MPLYSDLDFIEIMQTHETVNQKKVFRNNFFESKEEILHIFFDSQSQPSQKLVWRYTKVAERM